MGSIIAIHNNLIDQHNLPVEAARQWFVLLAGLALIIMMSLSVKQMFQTQRKVTFDQFIVIVEIVKVVLYIVYVFFLPHIIVMLLVFELQSLIRGIIGSKLVQQGIEINGHSETRSKTFQMIYLIILVALLLTIFILAFIPSTMLTCDTYMFTFHWFIITAIDIIQSLGIFLLSFKIKASLASIEKDEDIRFGKLMTNHSQFKMLDTQISVMAYAYIAFVVFDLALMIVGDAVVSEKEFKCLDKAYFLPEDSGTSLIMFGECVLIYLFSLAILFIFYSVPRKYGYVRAGNSILIDNVESSMPDRESQDGLFRHVTAIQTEVRLQTTADKRENQSLKGFTQIRKNSQARSFSKTKTESDRNQIFQPQYEGSIMVKKAKRQED